MKKLLTALIALAVGVTASTGFAVTPSVTAGLTATGETKVDVKGKKSKSRGTKKAKAAPAKK